MDLIAMKTGQAMQIITVISGTLMGLERVLVDGFRISLSLSLAVQIVFNANSFVK